MAKNYKIDRTAFLYLEPNEHTFGPKEEFAQCSTCGIFSGEDRKRCYILGKKFEVLPEDTCELYANGKPNESLSDQEYKSMSPDDAGWERRLVRCENCYWYGLGKCGLFIKLNSEFPDIFDLDSSVSAFGCCNSNTPKDAEFKNEGLLAWLNKDVSWKDLF